MGSATISHVFIPHPFHLLTRHVLILQPSITTLKPDKWVILITYLQVNKMKCEVNSVDKCTVNCVVYKDQLDFYWSCKTSKTRTTRAIWTVSLWPKPHKACDWLEMHLKKLYNYQLQVLNTFETAQKHPCSLWTLVVSNQDVESSRKFSDLTSILFGYCYSMPSSPFIRGLILVLNTS